MFRFYNALSPPLINNIFKLRAENPHNLRHVSEFYRAMVKSENCHNSRTSHDIDMKLGPITKLDKRNTAPSKNIDDYVMSANCDVITFFRFMTNLQLSGSRIPGAWPIKFTFSSTINFYLTET